MTNLEASASNATHRDIVVIGGSTGSIDALKKIVKALPADLSASIFIVNHVSPDHESYLSEILQQYGPLPAASATHGEVIRPGRIYVAPPNHHLLIEEGYIRLWRGPKENHCRPSINPLFRSAANAYGRRVIGIILSGLLDDGTAGLIAVKWNRGITIVQDPKDAEQPDMPRNAMRYIEVDYIEPAAEIAARLVNLTQESIVENGATVMGESADKDSLQVKQDITEAEAGAKKNEMTVLSCPDCSGPMWEFREGEFQQYQCRVGHKFSPEGILASHADTLERALWGAVRTLDERATLTREMANVARHTSNQDVVERFETEAQEATHNADIIRRMLLNGSLQPS